MDKAEQLLREYQNDRRKLEEQKEDIKQLQKKSQQLSAETYSEIRYLLSDISEDSQPLENARIELSRLEAEFVMTLEKEKEKLVKEQEHVEQRYREELNRLKKGD